jgi:hypothetical protein
MVRPHHFSSEDKRVNKAKNKSAIRNSRREFTKTLAVVAATPLIAGSAVAREQETRPAAAAPQNPPAEQPSLSALALSEMVRARYDKYITKEQMDQIKRSIDRSLRSADRMKQFELKNSDEPAFAFSVEVPKVPTTISEERDRERNRNRQ